MKKLWERDVYLLTSLVERSMLFCSKLYCSSNGLTYLMQNALHILKSVFYFVKGTSNIDNMFHISHIDLIDSVFGIIFLISEVVPQGKVLLGLQDQNKSFPSVKFRYRLCLNEQNENHSSDYFHRNSENQKLVKIYISRK